MHHLIILLWKSIEVRVPPLCKVKFGCGTIVIPKINYDVAKGSQDTDKLVDPVEGASKI